MSFNRAFNEHIKYSADGALQVNGVSVEAIAKEYGTPTYVYSLRRIVERYRAVLGAYSKKLPSVSLHYSMKANSNLAVIRTLLDEGAGVDCVSGGEVFKALKAGCKPELIVFAGVGKTEEDVDYAVKEGVCWFDVENEHELDHIASAARKHAKEVNVALRINPDVEADTHPSIATGHGSAKFGLPLQIVKTILGQAATSWPELRFKGLHLHIGSQLKSTDSTKKAIMQSLDYLQDFRSQFTHINIGGGIPINYGAKGALPTEEDFAAAVAPLLEGFHVMLEPGRSIVGDAGVLLTKVLYRKDQDGQRMLIVDTAMTELMRPALYQAVHPVGAVQETPGVTKEQMERFTIVGPVCESTDVLAKNVPLSDVSAQPGAMLALLGCGAYGACMASNYNARPYIAEVGVDKSGAAKLIRRRQEWSALITDEIMI